MKGRKGDGIEKGRTGKEEGKGNWKRKRDGRKNKRLGMKGTSHTQWASQTLGSQMWTTTALSCLHF